jgi:prepilin-type N-terminal cleavage/methylation domain-containing protein
MNPRSHDRTWLGNKKGFTLIEVLIATCLLAIAMLGLATLQSRGIRGNDVGNRTSQAIALAQDQLEELIHSASNGNFPLAVPSPNPFPDGNNPMSETGAPGGIFTRTWQLQDNTPVTDAQTITVTVSWNDLIGQHQVIEAGVITADGY